MRLHSDCGRFSQSSDVSRDPASQNLRREPRARWQKLPARRHRDILNRMLFMVIETFRNGDPVPVYRRFRDRGRMMPDGIEYRGSWVTADLRRCYQVMSCDDRRLLDQWMANWDDVTDFEVIPVVTS